MSIEKDGVGLIVVPEIHAQSVRFGVAQMDVRPGESGFVPFGVVASGVGHQDGSGRFPHSGQNIVDPVVHILDEGSQFRRAVVVVLRNAVDAPEQLAAAFRWRDALADRGAVEHFRNGESFSFHCYLVAGEVFELNEVFAVWEGTAAGGVSAARKKHTLVIVRIEDAGAAGLFELIQTGGGLRPLPRFVERRQQHGRQNGDDRYFIDFRKYFFYVCLCQWRIGKDLMIPIDTMYNNIGLSALCFTSM